MEKQRRADIIASIILILFSAIFYVIIPYQVGGGGELGKLSAMFPRIALGIMSGLSLILLIKRLRRKDEEAEAHDKARKYVLKKIALSLGIILAYVYLIDLFGFGLSTVAFLVVFIRFFGEKSWSKVILTTAIITGTLYFLMKVLFIPTPTGPLALF